MAKTPKKKCLLNLWKKKDFLAKAQTEAARLGLSHLHIEYVASALYDNMELANCFEVDESCPDSFGEECLKKWVEKFQDGYKSRISEKCSNPLGTVPDQAVNTILETVLTKIDAKASGEIVHAHRLGMSAENILGYLLEEYIFTKIQKLNKSQNPQVLKWSLAWGTTISKVDLCSSKGDLIQIKNRSNSENSSSSSVRAGTKIKKWFRINANNGHTYWDNLCKLLQCKEGFLSEPDFLKFIIRTLKGNPSALAIEPNSPFNRLR